MAVEEMLSQKDLYRDDYDDDEQMHYAQQEGEEVQDDSFGATVAAMSPLHIAMVTTPVCLMIYFCITQRADHRRNQAEEQNIIQTLAIAVVVGMLFFGGIILSQLAGQVVAPLGFLSTVFLPIQFAIPIVLPLSFLAAVL